MNPTYPGCQHLGLGISRTALLLYPWNWISLLSTFVTFCVFCFVLFLLCGWYLPVNWPWRRNWIQNMANSLCTYTDTTALQLSILSSLPMKCGDKIKDLDLMKYYMESPISTKDLLFLLKKLKGRKSQVWHLFWMNVVLLAVKNVLNFRKMYVCA